MVIVFVEQSQEGFKMYFEYKIVMIDIAEENTVNVLNYLGKEGWELVAVIQITPHVTKFYFKRGKR
jgi:hypothetical protein